MAQICIAPVNLSGPVGYALWPRGSFRVFILEKWHQEVKSWRRNQEVQQVTGLHPVFVTSTPSSKPKKTGKPRLQQADLR